MKTIPSENITLQFQDAHACVLFTVSDSLAGIKQGEAKKPFRVARLYVQAIDAYGFQRELIVQRTYRFNPGTDETIYFWQSHVYAHPERRNVQEISEAQAKHFISEFMRLARDYPTLLFNANATLPNGHFQPVSDGFVTLCERLHRCADLVDCLP